MSETTSLFGALKRILKSQGLTYRDLAKSLKLSEPSVKRMFSSKRMTIDRLMEIGKLLGFTLSELAQEAAAEQPRIQTLTLEQEKFLVADTRLLLTAVCVLNHLSMANIVQTYQLSEQECLQYLLQLDRLRLIDLFPGNRIRIAISRDFDWLPHGPIKAFFRAQGQDDFLMSSFENPGESMMFVHGMLSETAFSQLQTEIQRLRKRFDELHDESIQIAFDHKYGASLLLATRKSWEPAAFMKLRRTVPQKKNGPAPT
ncbi:MAG: helix-turn-helix domain-containing protein [Candidatus Accumulibacter sp.]|jgi:transcriptional regulator with XRE-family HTH domain|nr:helix-turn-helix domain-containing protein [Accumulibacter sp.]